MVLPTSKIEYKDKKYDEELLTPIKAIPPNWTVWDKIIINGSKTAEELINYIIKEYNVDVILITCNRITIVQTFILFNNDDNKGLKIEDIYKKEAKIRNIPIINNFLILQVNGEYNKVPVSIPLFRYNYIIK